MGYMNSMDIQHDRAGFYLCWGCLVSSNRYGVKAGDLLEVEDFSGGGFYLVDRDFLGGEWSGNGGVGQ